MSVDKLLQQISESLDSTDLALDGVMESFQNGEGSQPELVDQILNSIKSKGETNPMELVSLLSLKNTSLVGYITDLALLLSLRLKAMVGDDKLSSNKEEITKSSVTHRVTLERGVKSLEKKLSYQLEKLTAAYQRKEKEQKDIENNVHKQSTEDQSEEEEEEEDSEKEGEGLNFKPNLGALMGKDSKQAFKKGGRKQTEQQEEQEQEQEDSDDEEGKSKGKYRPPKIAAMALQSDPDKEVKSKKQRNLQSMDEYLQDISDAPMVEKSIGATIVNQGRDMKTKRQLEKEAEIKRYEEDNFTRLPAAKVKENKKDRSKRMRNEFFGEDWSMFDNNREFKNNDGNPAKKRKPQNAWDKAKRKIN